MQRKYPLQQTKPLKLSPSYANIKVHKTFPAHIYTQHKITNIRIKDETTILHSEKHKLNLQIYHLHISLANTLNNIWPHIHSTIEEKLHWETEIKYKNLDKKINQLTKT